VDFAKNAESWGAVGLRARTVEEFRKAVRRALKENRSVVIDAKVSPKSMTKGYESWWRVGTAEVSTNPKVAEAAAANKIEIAKTRKF
jgi:3D-(3,5/4)-trihydroxycyclohexane-1,2-dione acylhydrolase (decyclizing)